MDSKELKVKMEEATKAYHDALKAESPIQPGDECEGGWRRNSERFKCTTLGIKWGHLVVFGNIKTKSGWGKLSREIYNPKKVSA